MAFHNSDLQLILEPNLNVLQLLQLSHNLLHRDPHILCIFNMSLQSHRALELGPELLSTVFGLLDRQSNAANARVCKVWCDVALDALWMHVDDLFRLFAILAPLEGNFRKGYVRNSTSLVFRELSRV